MKDRTYRLVIGVAEKSLHHCSIAYCIVVDRRSDGNKLLVRQMEFRMCENASYIVPAITKKRSEYSFFFFIEVLMEVKLFS